MFTWKKLKHLNQKLILLFLTLTMIPLAIMLTMIYFTLDNSFTNLIEKQEQEIAHIIQTEFSNAAVQLLTITEMYSKDDVLNQLLIAKNRPELLTSVDMIYDRLASEHGVNVFEFGDDKGTVFLRGHSPEKYGDDKSNLPAIQMALSGKAISGFEFGKSGLAVRAFVPLKNDGQVIGTLQSGLNSSFLEKLTDSLPQVKIDIYNDTEEVVISSESERVGQKIDQPEVWNRLQSEQSFSERQTDSLISYLPMYDPTATEVIGMIGITQDLSFLTKIERTIVTIVMVTMLIVAVIVIFIALKFSQSIALPIKKVAHVMEGLSEGNLKVQIPENDRRDEIGTLLIASKKMKEILHQTMTEVSTAASSVSNQSSTLFESVTNVQQGTAQISSVLETIAEGSEQQAQHAIVLAHAMENFLMKTNVSTSKGENIKRFSEEVLLLADDGNVLMQGSEQQMDKLNRLIEQIVGRMEYFTEQTKAISELGFVVQNIATQTNLLALNAAIEASHAGESGKGFAVVAAEVKSLSEQVSQSIKGITKIIDDLQKESTEIRVALTNGYEEMSEGTKSIRRTSGVFAQIHTQLEQVVQEIQSISVNLNDMQTECQSLNGEIENTTAIAEEASASIQEIAATSSESNSAIEVVHSEASQLASLARGLENIVQLFSIEKNYKSKVYKKDT